MLLIIQSEIENPSKRYSCFGQYFLKAKSKTSTSECEKRFCTSTYRVKVLILFTYDFIDYTIDS